MILLDIKDILLSDTMFLWHHATI